MRLSADLPPSRLDGGLRTLSNAANHSVLWMGVAAGMGLAGGRARRAAVRGVLAVAGASALSNAVLKPVFPRRRPPAGTPEFTVRRGLPAPRSSSFPSGHSASAAAFATAVALEYPAAGVALAPLAAAVAYSRVHTGVHWPSDIAVGAGVGAAVALATRRWWAVRDEEPATLGPDRTTQALVEGDGMVVFVNPGSGSDDDAVRTEVEQALPKARIVEFDGDRDFAAQIDEIVAARSPKALGVCGGDGTVVTVAAAAVHHDLPLAVFPGGTLNHFARDAGVGDVASTAAAIADGSAELVDLGRIRVDGGEEATFVNTASLGGYPDSVRLRERWQPRLGKWPAAALAMARVLKSAQPLKVTIDGAEHAIWMLFVGNGRYTPSDQVPMSRPEIHRGTLDVRYLLADHRFSRIRLVAAALTGTLGTSPTYAHRNAPSVSIEIDGDPVALATDGEVVADGRRFEFRSEPRRVVLYRRL
ncbi:phosphatase PAP2 family protein [Rhodococcus hoagii]|jgi:undecaprenyl-diphosphatase|uniref:bifunctional phosphatase PAP2/diacylglycerol kinase family protein n=1 Tax=Prescottella TaxID=2979332 RepID=UPI0007CD9B7E|nr:bifunctional phosphatase PAP2/diacylglycerol kinase family protein [Prescottella equi]GBF15313.1 diacylglycerol kinase [Rhodococcus sp. Br-6]MBM4631050.1 phosphatase PAP2 family protein [Prescottella equi]MBM9835804.1 phosphatase PAP2 family protein [Prescottella equi]MDP8014366.1 diacylglycerol kinase family protein [Prescottella equi]NKR25802.1 phosphatase PAP2 family protein [Prescottella equi]